MKSDRIYCIDTNIFIWIHRYYPKSVFPDLWDELDKLFSQGKIISHATVFDEICHSKKNKDELAKWITTKQKYFREITQRQLELLPDIVKNFPKLIDPKSEKEQADPWLIAMLVEYMEESGLFGNNSSYVLVCGENRASTVKLPAACRHYNIIEMNLIEFFQDNNWTFRIM